MSSQCAANVFTSPDSICTICYCMTFLLVVIQQQIKKKMPECSYAWAQKKVKKNHNVISECSQDDVFCTEQFCVAVCATHCNTLQHTATHCKTLQHTATHDVFCTEQFLAWNSSICMSGKNKNHQANDIRVSS